ncbi:MAG: hypothetical protein RIT25_3005 [Planctomycetota bacterium]
MNPTETPRRPGCPELRRPDLDSLFTVNPDGSRNAIHPADVHGRFQRRKRLLWLVLVVVYLAMPWVTLGGKPAILIDIASRHFHLFGRTFNAQDFWLAFFYLSGLGFALFVVAALFGRLWCGYACPQTVFLEGVFRRIERLIEGPPAARRKLDAAGPTPQKVVRRGAKLLVFLAIAFVVAHSFLGYFMPVREILQAVTSPPTQHMTAFLFVSAFTLILFVNFTWFREQTCVVVCPYGRLQGVLYDPDTIVVGYDNKRGEPRGHDGNEVGGDCVDCFRCVAVCPTGIDIRNGTQMECVGCANCIDACDDVMTKLGRPTGLVRYDSGNGFLGNARRFFRPRVALYAVLLVMGVVAFTLAASSRQAFESNLLRAAGAPARFADGMVHNMFVLHLVNKLPYKARFTVAGRGPEGAVYEIAQPEVELDSLADWRIVVQVKVPEAALHKGEQAQLAITARADGIEPIEQLATATILGPTQAR